MRLSRSAAMLCACGLFAGASWAAPAPLTRPLVEPRVSKPDSVRALQRARADSLRATQPHPSGGQALAVGMACTLGPPVVSLLVNPIGSDSDFAWEASLAVSAAVGVLAGPAIGLASGGRGDLAKRGLIVRGIGCTAAALGLIAVVSTFEEGAGAGTATLAIAGLLGTAVTVVSGIHDLAITPSAVGKHRAVSVRAGVDPQGRLALHATF